MKDINVNILNITCVSNINAKHKSFELTVGLSDYRRLMTNDMWPRGVRARKFIIPKDNRTYQENTNDGDGNE